MGQVRRLIERVSRGKSFWRRLPSPYAAVRVLGTPDAALSFLKPGSGWVDSELLTITSRHVNAGDTVWDIGGNLGVFAAASALRCGRKGSVTCVEPDIYLAGLIRRTAARLPPECAPVSVLAAAVAAKFGIATFQIAERGRASNALAEFKARSETGGVRESVLVPVVSLDSLLTISPSPQLLKIDVEGAECEVLRGATELLSKVRPILYIEVGEQHNTTVTSLLKAASYHLFNPAIPVADQMPLESCMWNTLAIPVEKLP